MTPNALNRALKYMPSVLPDPGSAGTIRVAEKGEVIVGLKSAGAEARTLADPTRVGQLAFIYMDTDGGDITLTITSPSVNTSSTYTYNDAGDLNTFIAITQSNVLKWSVV